MRRSTREQPPGCRFFHVEVRGSNQIAFCSDNPGVTFEETLSFLADAHSDLPDVIQAVLAMATFASLIGRNEARDHAVEIAAELILSCLPAGLPV